MLTNLKAKMSQNELVQTFKQLEGNPKWSILVEPLWFIPFTLYSPFATLYMYELGVSQVQIGLIITISMVLQGLFAFVGGAITDKYGRRKTTFIFDTLSWAVPCFIWAFSQNFWWFLIAGMINATNQIVQTSWTCLFIEDCEEEHIVNAFTLIQIAGMLSVFVAPLTIVLIDAYTLVPVVRGIYFFSGLSMGLKFLLLYIYGGETKQGKIRMEETKNSSIVDLLKGNKSIFISMIKSKKIRMVMLFMGIAGISGIATNSFFAIYLTETLGLSEAVVAILPMIRTGIMLLFVLGIQSILNQMKLKRAVIVGLGILILSHLCLIVSPPNTLIMSFLYTVFEAIGYAIFMPRKDALMTIYVDKEERSRIYALLNMLMIILTAPFGWLIGNLATWNGRYPFVFNILLFTVGVLCIVGHKDEQLNEL